MYIAHPTHGAGTWPSRTQPPTAAPKTTLNAGQCVCQPREGRGRNRQAPPQKKTGGGKGGGRKNCRQPPHHPPTPQEAAKPPIQKAPKTGPPKRHRGTTQPKPATPSQEQGPNGKKETQKHADTHHEKKKSQQPSPKERGWGDRDHKARDRDTQQPTPQSQTKNTQRKKRKKHTPTDQQNERGTAKTRAQHARQHTAPQPGKGGNKRGTRTNTHPRTATPTRKCRRPRRTGARAHTHPNIPPRRDEVQPKPKPQHARPHRTPEPEMAGGKRSPHATTHVPYADRNLSPTTNTTNSRQKRDNTTNRAETHPPKTPARTCGVNKTHTQPQPGPKHKRRTTVGNPVPTARALWQPVPCRCPGQTRSRDRG